MKTLQNNKFHKGWLKYSTNENFKLQNSGILKSPNKTIFRFTIKEKSNYFEEKRSLLKST